jgi:hypothetical protein
MSSSSAAFAALQARLPEAARLNNAGRDFLVCDWVVPDKPVLTQRMGVVFDHDRDERILDFLTAAHYIAPQIRCNIVAVAESKARVTVWYGCPLTFTNAQRPLSEAAYKAVWPGDRWQVDLLLAPLKNGLLDRDRLSADSPLRAVPQRFQLGLLEKSGAR